MTRNVLREPVVEARVGIQGAEAETEREGGVTNALIGATHEFGAPEVGVPERSHFRSTFDENQQRYQRQLDRAATEMLDGVPLRRAVRVLGEEYRADVIETIRSGIAPQLAPSTVAKKGGEATPLLDTMQYLNSIRAVVAGSGERAGRGASAGGGA